MPVEAEVDSAMTLLLVDRAARLLLVVLRPVDSEETPVEADVDSTVTLLLVVLAPVESETTPVELVAMPVEADVDSAVTLVETEATPL
jgi:hypothetical protein